MATSPPPHPIWRWAIDRGLTPTVVGRAVWSLGLRSTGMLVGFAVQTLLVRTIGSVEYGEYVYALAWLNVLLLAGKLEFDILALRFVPVYGRTNQWRLLRGFLSHSTRLVLFVSTAVALVQAGVVAYLLRDASAPKLWAGLLSCALLPVSAVLTLQGGQLQGLHRTVAAQAPGQLVRPVVFAVTMVSLALFGGHLLAWHAVAGNLFGSAVALVWSSWMLYRALPSEIYDVNPSYKIARWLWSARRLMVISAAQLVVGVHSDLLVVGTLLGTRAAGLYGAVVQLSALVGFGSLAVTAIAVPLVSQHAAARERGDLQRLLHGMAWGTAAVTLPVLAIMVLFGRWGLALFTREYVSGYGILVLLSVSQAVAAIIGAMGGFAMTMTGHENEAARIIGASAVLNIVLSVALTPMLGVTGTALATLVATAARGIAVLIYVRRKLGLDVLPLPGFLSAPAPRAS